MDGIHCWWVSCLLTIRGLTLTTATDTEPASPNPGVLQRLDQVVAGLPGGVDGFLNLVARDSEDPQHLNSLGDLFVQQFIESMTEEDINHAISAYELAIGMVLIDD